MITEIISAGQYDANQAYIIGSRGSSHFIKLIGVDSNEELVSWKGQKLSGGCYNNGTFVVSTYQANNPYVYIIKNKQVRKVFTKDYVLTSVCFSSNQEVVGVGGRRGRIYYLNLATNQVTEKKLSEFVEYKPGRNLWHVSRKRNGYIVCGDKQLCLDFTEKSVLNIGDFDFEEHIYHQAVQSGKVTWISAMFQSKPILVKIEDKISRVYSSPTDKSYFPTMHLYNEGILLAGKNLFFGLPGAWRKIHDFGDVFITDIVLLPNYPSKLLCVGQNGKIEWVDVAQNE